MKKYQRYLVTSALPYANGPLHFGHLAGVYLPADIYTRHRRKQGLEVLHICGSDEHGVAIMIAAEKAGLTYAEYVKFWSEQHQALFEEYGIHFDFFGRTSQNYHHQEVIQWFNQLNTAGLIIRKKDQQLYCIDDQRFLPDRYVEGKCYQCGYLQARGDECPQCGEWIDPIRLIAPRSKMSGSSRIEIRETEQYYLDLVKLQPIFQKWFETKHHWRKVVNGFVKGLLETGVVNRAITRDLDWGIDVPLQQAQGKKLYVWFEAPIGYVSYTKEYFRRKNLEVFWHFNQWWNSSETQIVHFIGKDNIIFHAFIWPCMILGTKFVHLPTEIPANQFLNLDGHQFSKSSGCYIDAKEAVETFGMDALRFYLNSIIPEDSDSSFNWDRFASTYADLGNKVGNFVHRILTFIEKNWPEGLPGAAFHGLEDHSELKKIAFYRERMMMHFDQFRLSQAQSECLLLSQAANEYFHMEIPWKKVKQNPQATQKILAISVIYLACFGSFLEPFVPGIAKKIQYYFKGYLDELEIQAIYQGRFNEVISKFKNGFRAFQRAEILIPRIDPEIIEQWKEKTRI